MRFKIKISNGGSAKKRGFISDPRDRSSLYANYRASKRADWPEEYGQFCVRLSVQVNARWQQTTKCNGHYFIEFIIACNFNETYWQ